MKHAAAGRTAHPKARPDIKSVSQHGLSALLAGWGVEAYRAAQLLQWIYARRAARWADMTNLPRTLRERLAEHFDHYVLQVVRRKSSGDGTEKFLWRLCDGAMIESVVMPANPALYGDASDRRTLCLSTQVGCAYGCKFCASGLGGWKRNLEVPEIVDQVLAVERWAAERPTAEALVPDVGAPGSSSTGQALAEAATGSSAPDRWISNLVIMGMGEPLANYDNLMEALSILNAPWGGGIGARKITISTSGLVPEILRLAEESPQYRLAVSLHGATDEVRSQIMPINRKYPLNELVNACETYRDRKGGMLTLEFVLIEHLNDSLLQARALARLARRLHAKVNLIPYNRVEGLEWRRPAEEACEAFHDILQQAQVSVTLRREKGHDIDAACGQLRLRTEREEQA